MMLMPCLRCQGVLDPGGWHLLIADAECQRPGGRGPQAALPHLPGLQRAAPHPQRTEGQENISFRWALETVLLSLPFPFPESKLWWASIGHAQEHNQTIAQTRMTAELEFAAGFLHPSPCSLWCSLYLSLCVSASKYELEICNIAPIPIQVTRFFNTIPCRHQYKLFSVKVVQEYERAVIFRLGLLITGGTRGPGVFFVIPCVDVFEKIDMRTQTFNVPPQEVCPISNYNFSISVST